MVGYQDLFYVKENIIGYTGFLANNPTVYFTNAGHEHQKYRIIGSGGKFIVQFGRITQIYDPASNIGRSLVMSAASYAIYNADDEYGVRCAHESIHRTEVPPSFDIDIDDKGYWIMHQSRTLFTAVDSDNIGTLALAIINHTEIKPAESRYV